MRPLTAGELLDIWERGASLSSADRAQVLLRAAHESSRDPDPAQIPLGERDARLLTLRESTFGKRVAAVTRCPKCKGEIELTFEVSDLKVPPWESTGELAISEGEYQVKFRLPNSVDVAAVSAEAGGEESVRKHLLRRCIIEAVRNGQTVPAELLPELVVNALSDRMSELDPQAEIDLQLSCESCGERWSEMFDVESFFWAEINAWAGRLLNDVHQLAASYGWSERDILAMSAARRNAYLHLIAG
jgi:T4 bacteriophage base plate protein